MDDLDEFIGVPSKRRRGRPRKTVLSRPRPRIEPDPLPPPPPPPPPIKEVLIPPKDVRPATGSEKSWQALRRPVTIDWLALALGRDRRTVASKLAKCPTLPGSGAYDFQEAMSYLIVPKLSIAEMLRDIKKQDLPNKLQSDYWDAKLKEQKWMVNAGELWHTDRVLEVFGEAFKRMKNQITMFSNEVDDAEALTPVQRATLVELCDGLQRDLYEQLVELSQSRRTPSQAGEEDDV